MHLKEIQRSGTVERGVRLSGQMRGEVSGSAREERKEADSHDTSRRTIDAENAAATATAIIV